IVSALQDFKAEAGEVPRKFHADFDKKLIGGQALCWIISEGSKIIAANAGRQSSNGLVERTRRTIVQMARAYITEKQVGREFWFFSIHHVAIMLNCVPGRLGRKLTSPFELMHNQKPDSRTWFELFSVGYFNHSTDGAESRSKIEDHSLDGIAVGRDANTNTIIFYNSLTRSHYRPPAFRLDESRLPVTNFPTSIKYDGGLTCGLMRKRTDPVPEPFPPGTRVNIKRDDDDVRGTIQRVPLLTSPLVSTAASGPSSSRNYVVHLDDGTTIDQSFEEIVALTPPREGPTFDVPDPFSSLPHFLQRHSKLTMDHQEAFHKGFLNHTPEGGFQFGVRRNVCSTKVDWSVDLPNFKADWPTLFSEDMLIPGHSTVSPYLCPSSKNNAPSANVVSVKNILSPCPSSLLQALHPSNPDKHVWLDSYLEEKGGLKSLNVFDRISKKQYLTLRRQGVIPKVDPSMCVLVVKPDKDSRPHRAKSRIVVLGSYEDRVYDKSKRYAPVLKYSSLCLLTSMATGDRRILQQGDCKKAFCQATLPDDERMAVRPPPLVTQVTTRMCIGCSIKLFMASAAALTIGITSSPPFSRSWVSNPRLTILASSPASSMTRACLPPRPHRPLRPLTASRRRVLPQVLQPEPKSTSELTWTTSSSIPPILPKKSC
ncbi:hypothetical protein ACHAWF_005990, partial [Thalassiosira exigua]